MEYSFPPISPFLELIEFNQRSPNKVILRDHSLGVTATAGQLLHSVATLREKLRETSLEKRISISNSDENFIFMIAAPGLEYVVSMLTIFSIAIVIRPAEMVKLFRISNPVALFYAPAFLEKIEAIRALCVQHGSGVDPELPFVKIESKFPTATSSRKYIAGAGASDASLTSRAGSLFFTSGTSGNQKGVIHSHEALIASARERINTWKLTQNDVVLNQKPGNWIGGIFPILPTLMSGACLESCAGIFDPKWFWERIRQGGVSIFDIAAIGYDRLAQYFDEHIAVLPEAQREMYVREITAVKVASTSGSVLPLHTQARWTSLRRGKPLLNLYGSTEMTLICCMRWENPKYSDMCSVGPAVPGVEVKLVDGEMRLKAPTMFSRYLQSDQTEKAFDSEGFYISGDCAEKREDCYVMQGRASIDVLHFWGFTVHTAEVEGALFSLPYIADAVVLPLQDDNHQERTAAILKLKPSFLPCNPNLETLRGDLTEKIGLMLFKQPTVVYWLRETEEVSVTVNGKVSKVDSRRKFFGDGWWQKEGVEVLDLSSMGYWRMGGQC